jgi:hypothetical protein
MAFEGSGKKFSSLYAEIDSAIFDCRDSRLRKPGFTRQFALTHLLKFTKNSDRFADSDFSSLFRWTKVFHLISFDNHARSGQ